MKDKWLVPMRIYFVVTLVLVAVYAVGRAFTPFWLDIAFIAWCGLFALLWNVYSKRRVRKSSGEVGTP